MRLLISGGRHFDDTAIIRKELDHIQNAFPISVLIHGGLPALGVEAENWAREHNIHVIRYPANWSLLGKHAEARRNAFMLEDSRPDIILMFPGGRQTAFFERTVRELRIPMTIVGPSNATAISEEDAEHPWALSSQPRQSMHI